MSPSVSGMSEICPRLMAVTTDCTGPTTDRTQVSEQVRSVEVKLFFAPVKHFWHFSHVRFTYSDVPGEGLMVSVPVA